jgi:hypothetical protein
MLFPQRVDNATKPGVGDVRDRADICVSDCVGDLRLPIKDGGPHLCGNGCTLAAHGCSTEIACGVSDRSSEL